MKERLILLMLLILLPVSTKALDCSYSEQAKLRKLASNVTTSYEYVENENGVTFNVTITNLTGELYAVDSITGNAYYYNGNNEFTLYGYAPGTNIRYEIYPARPNCTRSYLTIKYVNLPYYNSYYKDEICSGKNYTMCNKWQKVTLPYDDFVKRVKELDNNKTNEIVVDEPVKMTILDYIVSFVFDYYIVIIIVGVGIFVGAEAIRRKRNDFDF